MNMNVYTNQGRSFGLNIGTKVDPVEKLKWTPGPGHAPSQWRNYRQCSRTGAHAAGWAHAEHTRTFPHRKWAPGDEDNMPLTPIVNYRIITGVNLV